MLKHIRFFFRRYLVIIILSIVILGFFNLYLGYSIALNPVAETLETSPAKIIEGVSDGLARDQNGTLTLSETGKKRLEQSGAWAILIDNTTSDVIWQDQVPPEIPTHFTPTDIAGFARYYLADYPAFTWENPNGLLVLGFPKDSYLRLGDKYYSVPVLQKTLYQTLPILLLLNLIAIMVIYIVSGTLMMRPVRSVVLGLEALSGDKSVHLLEKGAFAEVFASINQASEVLSQKNEALRKKDSARANWIAGVSHDIRTPLAIILGYAEGLKKDETAENAQVGAIISHQALRIKSLVNDLNLASRLEYEMQPVRLEPVDVLESLRCVITDTLNNGLPECYTIRLHYEEDCPACKVLGDAKLFERAVVNLIQNSIRHNPEGCDILIKMQREGDRLKIMVSDNGIGAPPEKLKIIQTAAHYIQSEAEGEVQNHGLGLFIVKKVIAAMDGEVRFESEEGRSFSTTVWLSVFKANDMVPRA